MPSLTDGAIRQAIKRVEIAGKQESLTDGEGRGTGRLVLVLKSMPRRVTAEWMAQQWRDGKRAKAKLGDYPSMSLAQAREVFKRDYAAMIQKGRSIKIADDTRPGTVADLFEAYVRSLRDANKPSWKETEKGLNKIAERSVEVASPVRSSPPRLPKSFGRSTSGARELWRTTFAVTFVPPIPGACNRNMTIAAHHQDASGLSITPRPESQRSRRSSAYGGSTKTSSCASTVGSSVLILPFILPRPAPYGS